MLKSLFEKATDEWEMTFNAITDFIFVLDVENRIIKVNQPFLDALKLRAEDVIGKKCYEILHKSDKPWPGCPHQETIVDKKAHTAEVDDPNIGIPLLVTNSPIFDKKGNMIGSVHIAKDISKLKETEKDIKKKMHDLEVFHKAAVGREMRIIELKKKVAELEKQLAGK